MKNKGFTLVELIAIILILSIILTVAFTTLSKSLENSNEKKYQTMIENLALAAEEYTNLPGVYRKINQDLNDGKRVTVDIIDLINAGIIDEIPTNPKTNKEVTGYVLVYKNSENEFMFEVQID